MHHSTTTPTKAEAERFVAMKFAGCVCCHMHGWPGIEPDIHHLLSGGKRRGHRYTVALCRFHHMGHAPTGWTAKTYAELVGPSLAQGSKPFHAVFGTDETLLMYQDRLIGWTDIETS